MNYVNNQSKNLGHYSVFNFEQKSYFNKNLLALNQLKAKSISIESDLVEKINLKKNNHHEVILGENYLRFQNDSFIFQAGYQDIVWGESFGFNYADVINPKDNRITLYSSQEDVRIPILLINTKVFFQDGSLQLIYSPEPKFNKTLPVDLFIGNQLSQSEIIVRKESTPKFFKEHEYGFKLSYSLLGSDLSLFYYNYLDRNPYYAISSVSTDSITLDENHSRISSSGLSFAKAIDDFVFRSDIVLSDKKRFNYLSGFNFSFFESKSKDLLISLDFPSINKYTGMIILANKTIEQQVTGSFQQKSETQIIARLTKSLEMEKSIDLSYTHDFNKNGKAIQGIINWPVNNNTIITMGTELYIGNSESPYGKVKKINNVFFSIKNFFKI